MSGFMEKVKDFIGVGEDYEDFEEYEDYDESVDVTKKTINNNVVTFRTNNSMKIVVHEPLSYEEATEIVNDLKSKKTVIVNLEELEVNLKRRIFDFINGGLYSMEGNIQKITKDIFVLAPTNVEIDGLKDELKNKGIFSW